MNLQVPRWRKTLRRRLAEFGYRSYKEYLRSPHWLELKKQFFTRHKRQCRICGERKKVDLHHVTYRRLGEEWLEDLIALCRTHHKELHAALNAKAEEEPRTSLRTVTGEYFFGDIRYRKLERRRLIRRMRGKRRSHFAWTKKT